MTTLINKSQGTPVHLDRNQHNHVASNHVQRNGHKNKGGGNNTRLCNSYRDYCESDIEPSRDGTYRRYLEVNHYPEEEYTTHTLPNNHTQICAVDVTIEKSPRSRDWNRETRDQTPSPRPDVVQEEKFLYPPDMQGSNDLRRLSVDTVKSDKSDVWKPMDPKTQQGNKNLNHKAKYSEPRPPETERRTLPRVNFNLDNLEPKSRDTNWDNCNSKYSTYPHPQPVYSEDPYINNRTVYIPPPPGSTVYHNRPPSSNNSPQLKHPPPKPPQRSPHTELQSGRSSPTPDMFYTRPKRTAVPNPQAKHAAV